MLAAVDIDLETSADGIPYMDDSDEKLDDAIVKYTEYQKEERQRVSEDQRAMAEQDAARKKTVREEKERDEQQSVAAARKAESERQFEAEKKQLEACVQSFKRMSTSVKELVDISSMDRRLELKRIESEHASLNQRYSKLLAIDPAADFDDINKMMKEDVDDLFHDVQKVTLELLKDSSPKDEAENKHLPQQS